MFFLECTNLAKFFGKTKVFRGLNFRFEGALCVGIQGANGSGKSTLMKCLSGLLRPSEGEIQWLCHGEPISTQSIRHFLGFAAPYIHLYHELSVSENLSFIKRLRPFMAQASLPTKPPTLQEILEMTSLSGIENRDFGLLSSGQQQRVRLASALIADPPILMLDEPGTNLDAEGIALVAELVARQIKRGGMVFLSSNREDELALSSTRIVLSSLQQHKPEIASTSQNK